MSDISIYNDTVYEFFDELYKQNHREWKKRILSVVKEKHIVTFKQIKEGLEEVTDLLVYRCIKDLIVGQVLIKERKKPDSIYYLDQRSCYIRELLISQKQQE